jgi:type IV pilus assembly protein PilO
MNKFLDQIVKAPLGMKIGVLAGVIVAITLLNYSVLGMDFGGSISDTEKRITRAKRDQAQLDKEYIEKTAIANNLNQFRREKELLEQQLTEALAELPEDKKIEDLLQVFEDRALKAGLKIQSIEPKAPTSERFYAKIPIPMAVTGNYHEMATFFDSLSRMRRIVNVSEVMLSDPKDVNGKVVLNGKFLVTAFMFVTPTSKAAAPGSAR